MSETQVFNFRSFSLDPSRRALMRGEQKVELGSRAFDVLLAMVRRHGQIATKSDIMDEVWPGVTVEENNLTTQVATVRRVLGCGVDGKQFIVTVPGRGYRFIEEVAEDNRLAQVPEVPAQPASPAPDTSASPIPDLPPLVEAAALSGPAERHNLPAEPSSFIGRETELAEIAERLNQRALVTIAGPGGVGKTRAALKVGAEMLPRFPDGVWLVELAPVSESALVAEAVCRVLGAQAASGRDPLSVAVGFLRQKRMLLILDNCEHVLAGAADLAAAIGRSCPDLHILATSQEKLAVPGEAVFPMPSLRIPDPGSITAEEAMRSDAVRLFIERATDTLGSFVLTDEDAPHVAAICRGLDGLPLATELAAARLRMLKPAEMAQRLEKIFRLLATGSRAVPARHQTLRATIDWSYSLLAQPEQTLLRRLGVFLDGWTLAGAVAVAGGGTDDPEPDEVFDLLSALVDKSLVVADTSGPVTRYRMLEMTRQYASEKLAESGETSGRRRMAEHLLAVFTQAEQAWPTMPTDAFLATYCPEIDNLRSAIDWAFGAGASPSLGVALVAHAGRISEEMSLQSDLARWTAAALPHLQTAPAAQHAAVLYLHAAQQKHLGARTVPPERQKAIALFREAGDVFGLSRTLRQTAIAMGSPGDIPAEMVAMLEEAVALARPFAPNKDLATALAHTGALHFLNAEHDMALTFNEEALAMRRKLRDRTGVLASFINLAELFFLEGDTDLALRYALEADAEALACNALSTRALVLANIAGYRLSIGDFFGARAAAREALALNRALGLEDYAIICLEHLALAAALEGDLEAAAKLAGHTDAFYRRTGQIRDRLEQAGFERLMDLLRERFPPAVLKHLQSEGIFWSNEAADAAVTTIRPALAETPA
jgi:predicted ATPase/DNA-binding winged helix-turn-helix (wHTH) protein